MIIEIEGKYLDIKKIKKEQFLLKKIINLEVTECLEKYGFKKKNNYYENKNLFLKAKIKITSEI